MTRRNVFTLLFAPIIFLSCKKENSSEMNYPYSAVVVSNLQNNLISCNKNVASVKITEKVDKALSIAFNASGHEQDSIFIVLDLPEDLKINGLSIMMDLRKPSTSELPSCHNFEMPVMFGEPIVYVVRAKAK